PHSGSVKDPHPTTLPSRPLLTLSGRTVQALVVLAQRYQDFLVTNPTVSLADLCHTAQTGRTHFAHRLAISASNTEQLREHLAAFVAGQPGAEAQVGYAQAGQRPIAFLFPGQGCQYVHMARQLYETQPTFRAALDECDRILGRGGSFTGEVSSLLSVLYPADGA